MPRRCIVAGCDYVGREGCSLYNFPKDATIRKKWIKPVKEQRNNLDSPFLCSLLCSNHFTEDCFIIEGVRFRDELGMSTQLNILSLVQCERYLQDKLTN